MTWTEARSTLRPASLLPFVTISTTYFGTTISFLVYPIFLVAALSRRYPLLRIAATALLFAFTTFSHVYFETPFDQYRTWAEGSPVPLRGIQHTLLNTESRTAGILAATITVLLSLFLGLALWQFILEWRRGEAAK